MMETEPAVEGNRLHGRKSTARADVRQAIRVRHGAPIARDGVFRAAEQAGDHDQHRADAETRQPPPENRHRWHPHWPKCRSGRRPGYADRQPGRNTEQDSANAHRNRAGHQPGCARHHSRRPPATHAARPGEGAGRTDKASTRQALNGKIFEHNGGWRLVNAVEGMEHKRRSCKCSLLEEWSGVRQSMHQRRCGKATCRRAGIGQSTSQGAILVMGGLDGGCRIDHRTCVMRTSLHVPEFPARSPWAPG